MEKGRHGRKEVRDGPDVRRKIVSPSVPRAAVDAMRGAGLIEKPRRGEPKQVAFWKSKSRRIVKRPPKPGSRELLVYKRAAIDVIGARFKAASAA